MKKKLNEMKGLGIGQFINESTLAVGGTMHLLNNGASDIVAISGSILAGDYFGVESNPELATITTAMLDQGTFSRTKQDIEDALESVGATMSFRSSAFRVYFSITCLRDNLEEVIEILADQLNNPQFPEKELKVLKTRFSAMVREQKEDTRSQANESLTRILYQKTHPYYINTPEEVIRSIEKITVSELKAYHKNHFDLSTLKIAVVGDVNSKIELLFNKYFTNTTSSKKSRLPINLNSPKQVQVKKKVVVVPGKANADLVIGKNIAVRKTDPDYLPLFLAISIFGGSGFTARLMNEVREKRGLTYGINASLQGVSLLSDCYLVIWGTFAPKVVSIGKKVILDEYTKLVKRGVTNREVEEIKKELIGLYQVSLETTPRLASTILANLESAEDKTYIDSYSTRLSEITTSQVNDVIKRYLLTDHLSMAIAGTVEQNILD